jgi:SH3 domain protein
LIGRRVCWIAKKKEIMLRATLPLLLLTLCCAVAQAQDVRYVSDKQYVPLRSGGGNEFRIVHRGIPSATKLTVASTSDDGEWSEIMTERGTSGWMRSQYLMETVPAQLVLDDANAKAAQAAARSAALAEELRQLKTERASLQGQVATTGTDLESVTVELDKLKQISGKSVQLDSDNRRLVVESENLRSDTEMLEAENQRLRDKIRSEDYINGALAVLMGVILTLVIPRLVPKRRRNSEWA